jgi:hypothetical protein
MTMRVLVLAEADPAGVMCGWREALRAANSGYALTVAVRQAFGPGARRADWVGTDVLVQTMPNGTRESYLCPRGTEDERSAELKRLVALADMVLLCPGIGVWAEKEAPWAMRPAMDGAAPVPLGDRPVGYVFHGSRFAWANRESYREVYKGCVVGATTLDYVLEMGAEYVPPAMFDVYGVCEERRAADDGVRLFVDGKLIFDEWRDQPPATFVRDVALPAGAHRIVFEFYDNSGGATAKLNWQMLVRNRER